LLSLFSSQSFAFTYSASPADLCFFALSPFRIPRSKGQFLYLRLSPYLFLRVPVRCFFFFSLLCFLSSLFLQFCLHALVSVHSCFEHESGVVCFSSVFAALLRVSISSLTDKFLPLVLFQSLPSFVITSPLTARLFYFEIVFASAFTLLSP